MYVTDFGREVIHSGIGTASHSVKYITDFGRWIGRDIATYHLSYPAGSAFLALGMYHSINGDGRGMIAALAGAAVIAGGHIIHR